MSNLKEWFAEDADGDDNAVVVIKWVRKKFVPNHADVPVDKIITWDEAKKWIDVDFDSGFGADECPFTIYVWTSKNVFTIDEYDGANGIVSLPRNPTVNPY